MTPTEQIEHLDNRVTRLEERYLADLSSIHAKIDGLVAILNRSMVDQASKSCPAPGSCIGLGESLKSLIINHNATMLRVERLELRMMDAEKWQSRIMGGFSIAVVILTLFGPTIRKLFGLA
jgi:hypothetical protein